MIKKYLQKIKSYFFPSYLKEIRYQVIDFDPEISKGFHDLHWFLTCQLDEGKLPMGVLYMGPIGNDQMKIEVIFDERSINQEKIENYLKKTGINAELLK